MHHVKGALHFWVIRLNSKQIVLLLRVGMKRGSLVALISGTHLETELVVYIFYADALKVCEPPRISFTAPVFEAEQSTASSFYKFQVIAFATYYDKVFKNIPLNDSLN